MSLFPIPDLLKARKVLAVQPHYDDNDIPAGGTLAALAENGAKVIYLTVTDDLVGFIDQSQPVDVMVATLHEEQRQAGAEIGVSEHYWLGYPDAGPFDHFDVRRDVIRYIRLLRPDFIFTCDPWLPYEAHLDHIRTGLAVAEAAILYNFSRLTTAPEVDAGFEPYELEGIVFYGTAHPNTVFDITRTYEKKHRAVQKYRSQFDPNDMALLLQFLDHKERETAQGKPFSHGEPIKVLRTRQLHGWTTTWKE